MHKECMGLWRHRVSNHLNSLI